jgi:hypothetical protein
MGYKILYSIEKTTYKEFFSHVKQRSQWDTSICPTAGQIIKELLCNFYQDARSRQKRFLSIIKLNAVELNMTELKIR